MRWICYIIIFLLLTPNSTLEAASIPAVQEERLVTPPVKPAAKKKIRKSKKKFKPQRTNKQQNALLLLIVLWFGVLLSLFVFVTAGAIGGFPFIITSLIIFGVFNLTNLIIFMLTYSTISGGEVMANFVIGGFVITVFLLNLLAGLSFLIWGLLSANPLLWITGLAALAVAAVFVLTFLIVNAR